LAANIEKLDSYLCDKSYLGGFTPSKLDQSALTFFPSEPEAKFINLARWWRQAKTLENIFLPNGSLE